MNKSLKSLIIAMSLSAPVVNATSFPIVPLDGDLLVALNQLDTKTLCNAAAISFGACNAHSFNHVNMVIEMRGAKLTDECQAGYDEGYEDFIELSKGFNAEMTARIQACDYYEMEGLYDEEE